MNTVILGKNSDPWTRISQGGIQMIWKTALKDVAKLSMNGASTVGIKLAVDTQHVGTLVMIFFDSTRVRKFNLYSHKPSSLNVDQTGLNLGT
jgi:hypothetical protein